MKRISYLSTIILFAFILLMSSCKKDEQLFQEEQLKSEAILQQGPHIHADGRSCGKDHLMEKLMKDPEFRIAFELKMEKVAAMSSSRSSSTVNLPIAVHFQNVGNADVNCLRTLAASQVQILNDDFQGTNSDISTWTANSSSFPGTNNGQAAVEFCLASQNHPSGFGLQDGDPAVTVNQTNGDFVAAWSGYINIFVRPNLGYLGYSPLGGNGNGDGVVIDANAFGSGSGCGSISPNAPYDLGRTLTHELGHYLLLDHIWGGNGGCNDDDAVNDTPVSSQPYYGCPNVGASSCSSTDLHMNYMDYTNDACMYMFSAGQATRVENYIAANLGNVVSNAAAVCGSGGGGGGGTNPTCDDGIQNGDETGVDCGGSCPPCETAGGDAGVRRILRPVGVQNTNDITPRVRFRNYGSTALTSVDIVYNVDGGADQVFSWTGTLQPNRNKTINLPQMNVAGGDHSFNVRTENPNGGTDTNPANDARSSDFSTPGGGGGSEQYTIRVKPDDYGSEITWELIDDYGTVLSTGGPYTDGNTSLKTKNVNLDPGCYTFVIYDAWGDGICCDWGQGWYDILDGSGTAVIDSDGQYGYYEEQFFCVGTQARIQSPKIMRDSKDLAALAKKRKGNK